VVAFSAARLKRLKQKHFFDNNKRCQAAWIDK
jgi:hypothetical protein